MIKYKIKEEIIMKKRIISVIALLLMFSSIMYIGLKNNEKKSPERY